MRIFGGKPKVSITVFLSTYFDENKRWQVAEDQLQILTDLIRLIRPSRPEKEDTVNLTELLFVLKNHDAVRTNLSAFLNDIFHQRRFKQILTDAGILQDINFFTEVRKRLFAKILPVQPAKERAAYLLNQVFFQKNDPVWIGKIPKTQLYELYDLLGYGSVNPSQKQHHITSQLIIAMTILIQRSNGRAMDTEVMKMVPEFDNLESPFSGFEKELLEIDAEIKNSPSHYIRKDDLSYKQLTILLQQCELFVDKAFNNSRKYGISLRTNQNMLRIRQQLERLKALIPLLAAENRVDVRKNEVNLALMLIQYNCYQNNLQTLIDESTQLLSYEVTQHTAKTGERYITETRSEYYTMLKSALGGGLIVGLLVIFKLLLSKTEISDFGYAFLYSMNYSAGFITIYLLGFTLATKQPAMTASAIISALKKGLASKGDNSQKHKAFAILFARLFRSQFIAFIGNVFMAFPVAMLGIWLIDLVFANNIAEAKWEQMITKLSPVHSLALFHASLAGIYLFLSGIIAGSASNKGKHNQIYYRIQEHPMLKMTLGPERTMKLSKWYEKKWAGIISNFWFGVFMGSTASVGIFLGLNLDIRHITFASGDLALSLYGGHFSADFWMIFWAILGVGLIGLANFLVSFSLSLGLAFRSRRIPITELKPIIASIWDLFKEAPLAFFYPPKVLLQLDNGDSEPEKFPLLKQTVSVTDIAGKQAKEKE